MYERSAEAYAKSDKYQRGSRFRSAPAIRRGDCERWNERVGGRVRYLHITQRQTGRRTSLSYAKSRQRAALLSDQNNIKLTPSI